MMTIKTFPITGYLAAACAVFAPHAGARQFTVNSIEDAVDVHPGDGICATESGVCTLRAAIQESNALPGADEVIVPGAVYLLTIGGAGEDCSATGDLDITDDLLVLGAGPKVTIVDAG